MKQLTAYWSSMCFHFREFSAFEHLQNNMFLSVMIWTTKYLYSRPVQLPLMVIDKFLLTLLQNTLGLFTGCWSWRALRDINTGGDFFIAYDWQIQSIVVLKNIFGCFETMRPKI